MYSEKKKDTYPFSIYFSKKNKNVCLKKDLYKIFIEVWFIIGPNWKQVKCSSIDFCISFYVNYIWRKIKLGRSGQDGGIGRDPSLPCTTKRRITTNLKSINNQQYQKSKLHGTPTTKELKKISTRTTSQVRRWTMQANSEKLRQHGGPWGRG